MQTPQTDSAMSLGVRTNLPVYTKAWKASKEERVTGMERIEVSWAN